MVFFFDVLWTKVKLVAVVGITIWAPGKLFIMADLTGPSNQGEPEPAHGEMHGEDTSQVSSAEATRPENAWMPWTPDSVSAVVLLIPTCHRIFSYSPFPPLSLMYQGENKKNQKHEKILLVRFYLVLFYLQPPWEVWLGQMSKLRPGEMRRLLQLPSWPRKTQTPPTYLVLLPPNPLKPTTPQGNSWWTEKILKETLMNSNI